MDIDSMSTALLRLEPSQRQLLRLATRQGMTYRRLAEVVGASPGEVLSDLRLALTSLRTVA